MAIVFQEGFCTQGKVTLFPTSPLPPRNFSSGLPSGKFCSKCILGLFKIMHSIACDAGV